MLPFCTVGEKIGIALFGREKYTVLVFWILESYENTSGEAERCATEDDEKNARPESFAPRGKGRLYDQSQPQDQSFKTAS